MVTVLRNRTLRGFRMLRVRAKSKQRELMQVRAFTRQGHKRGAEEILTRYRETFEILGRQ